MHLIQLDLSLSSFKVRLALRLKRIDVPLEDPPGGSYRSEAFRALNPAGTIPLLVDGDLHLAETDAIVEYLDDIGAGEPLRPNDARLAARSRMIARWIDFRIDRELRLLFPYVGVAGGGGNPVSSADERMSAGLAVIDAGLDPTGPFAVGVAPSLADCGLLACMVWLEALREPLALAATPGQRALRVRAAMEADERLRAHAADYCSVVAAWVAARRRPAGQG